MRTASNRCVTCNELKSELNLDVTPQTIANYLRGKGDFSFIKMINKPFLNKKHFKSRLTWAIDKENWSEQWGKEIFSDV